jgi:hypothetical protein
LIYHIQAKEKLGNRHKYSLFSGFFLSKNR